MASRLTASQEVAGFGPWLVSLRESRGLMQRHVAAALDMDPTHYRKFESEDRWPNLERVRQLAEYFEQPLERVQARLTLAKVMAQSEGNDVASFLGEVHEAAAAMGVSNLSATTGKRGGKKK